MGPQRLLYCNLHFDNGTEQRNQLVYHRYLNEITMFKGPSNLQISCISGMLYHSSVSCNKESTIRGLVQYKISVINVYQTQITRSVVCPWLISHLSNRFEILYIARQWYCTHIGWFKAGQSIAITKQHTICPYTITWFYLIRFPSVLMVSNELMRYTYLNILGPVHINTFWDSAH